MRAKEAARRAGVSVKALRYYESLGLIAPARLANGYRDYSELDVQLSGQIAALLGLGLSAQGARPFLECLRLGHQQGDECTDSLRAYAEEIQRLDRLLAELTQRREALQHRLDAAAQRGFPEHHRTGDQMTLPRYDLPENLPVPTDDGRAAHLVGLTLPNLHFVTHDGQPVRLGEVASGRWILFVYPTTGVPGQDLPEGWDSIPGARGCTPEACGFRDGMQALRDAGAQALLGLSHQSAEYQRELAQRLHLPYGLLSDPERRLGEALRLPTFRAGNDTFYSRLTLVVRGDRIEHVFYPIFPPNEHAAQVLDWLRTHPEAD